MHGQGKGMGRGMNGRGVGMGRKQGMAHGQRCGGGMEQGFGRSQNPEAEIVEPGAAQGLGRGMGRGKGAGRGQGQRMGFGFGRAESPVDKI